MAEQFVPHFPTQPGKFYFVVNCPDTDKPIPFMEDESGGGRPYPRRPLIVSCPHCQMMHEIIVPTIVSRQIDPDSVAPEDERVGNAPVGDDIGDFIVRRDEAAETAGDEAADFIVKRDDAADNDQIGNTARPADFIIRRDQVASDDGAVDAHSDIDDVGALPLPLPARDALPDAGLNLAQPESSADMVAAEARPERRRNGAYSHVVRVLRPVVLGTLLFLVDSLTQFVAALRHVAFDVSQFCAASATQVVVALRHVAFEVVHFSAASVSHVVVALQHAAFESALFFGALLSRSNEGSFAGAAPGIPRFRSFSPWDGGPVLNGGRSTWLLVRERVAKTYAVKSGAVMAWVSTTLVLVALQVASIAAAASHATRSLRFGAREVLSAGAGALSRLLPGGQRFRVSQAQGLSGAVTASLFIRIGATWSRLWASAAAEATPLLGRANERWSRTVSSTGVIAAELSKQIGEVLSRFAASAASNAAVLKVQARTTWARFAKATGPAATLCYARIGDVWSRGVASAGPRAHRLYVRTRDTWARCLALAATMVAPLHDRSRKTWSHCVVLAAPIVTPLYAWSRKAWMRIAAFAGPSAELLYARYRQIWPRRIDDRTSRRRRPAELNRAALDRRQLLALRRPVLQKAVTPRFVYHVESPHSDLLRQSFNLMSAASALANDHEVRQLPALGLAEAALEAFCRDHGDDAEQQLVGLQTIVLALGSVGEPRGPDDASGASIVAQNDQGPNRAEAFR